MVASSSSRLLRKSGKNGKNREVGEVEGCLDFPKLGRSKEDNEEDRSAIKNSVPACPHFPQPGLRTVWKPGSLRGKCVPKQDWQGRFMPRLCTMEWFGRSGLVHSLSQQTDSLLGKIGDGEAGPGAANGDERFENGAVPVEPAPSEGCFKHRVFPGDLVSAEG